MNKGATNNNQAASAGSMIAVVAGGNLERLSRNLFLNLIDLDAGSCDLFSDMYTNTTLDR